MKKYYIVSLKKTVCDYCEVPAEGELKTLCYFQGKRDCKHLIKDFGECKEELFKIQNVCKNNENNDKLAKHIVNSRSYMSNPYKKAENFNLLMSKFNDVLEKNLLPFINQIEDLKKVKELIAQIKFDSQGKVNLTGIGNDPELESKLIWLSLFLINLREKNTRDGDRDFDFSDDLIDIAKQMVRTLYEQCLSSFEFFKNFCNVLLPEVSLLEGEENKLTYEELMKDFKLTNNDERLGEMNINMQKLKDRIFELEKMIAQADLVNKDLSKFKEMHLKEVEKNQALNLELEKQNKNIIDLNGMNDLMKTKMSELEKQIQKLNQEKTDMKNNYEKLIRENDMNNNERLRQIDILLKEKDLIIDTQRKDIDRFGEHEKSLKDRIHELELHLLKEKESKKMLDTNYEKLNGDYTILLKRLDFYSVFANDTKNILNGS